MKMKITLGIVTLLILTACAEKPPATYTAIKTNPAELDYAKYTCRVEADAVGDRISDSVAAATPDVAGGGFAGGFANGLQGLSEGISASRNHYKACIARFGYRID